MPHAATVAGQPCPVSAAAARSLPANWPAAQGGGCGAQPCSRLCHVAQQGGNLSIYRILCCACLQPLCLKLCSGSLASNECHQSTAPAACPAAATLRKVPQWVTKLTYISECARIACMHDNGGHIDLYEGDRWARQTDVVLTLPLFLKTYRVTILRVPSCQWSIDSSSADSAVSWPTSNCYCKNSTG